MRRFALLFTLAAILVMSVAPSSAQGSTIVDIAASNGNFSTLVAAVQAAGLADELSSGEYTVFAPTNAAFAKLLNSLNLSAEQLLSNQSLLTSVLLYHVVPGTVKSGDIVAANTVLYPDTANGSRIRVEYKGGNVLINNAKVSAADIEASNGVIHVIDTVLLPPPTITDVLGATTTINGEFSILMDALSAAGLQDALKGAGPYTLFAPTNRAFANLLATLGVTKEELFANTELLTTVLLYHVVPGEFLASDVAAATAGGDASIGTLQGGSVTLSTSAGVRVNASNVTQTNILANNGVIHVIDAVLLP
ncbi:MAG: fasciclin domain-containing protein [Anaerolineae bacterium]|nr:fasciclin domain-containing protein [Anaerolineae bacterium]